MRSPTSSGRAWGRAGWRARIRRARARAVPPRGDAVPPETAPPETVPPETVLPETDGALPEPADLLPIPELPVDAHPELFIGRTHGIVDFSEDVSSRDLEAAVAEGFDSAELAKRFTTATMRPLQGKLETVNAAAVAA